MAVCQVTWILMVYISIPAVTAAHGFALTASHFGKAGMPAQPKVTKGLLPLSFGASPRLGMPSLRSCSVGCLLYTLTLPTKA